MLGSSYVNLGVAEVGKDFWSLLVHCTIACLQTAAVVAFKGHKTVFAGCDKAIETTKQI